MDDYNIVFTALVNSYEDYKELENFACQYGLKEDPHVKARLDFLFDRDVTLMVADIDEFNETCDDTVKWSNEESTKRQKLNMPSTSQTGGADVSRNTPKPYYIEQKQQRKFKTTLATDTSYKVKFNEQWQGERLKDISDQLHNMFEDVLSQARGHDADLGRVIVQHPNLQNPMVVPLQPWENLNADVVMENISKVLNSHENLDCDENMTVTVGSISLPKGGAKLPTTQLFGPRNSLQRKQSIFYIENDNNLCLAISIALCFLKTCKKVDSDTWSSVTHADNDSEFSQILKHKTVSKHYYDNVLKKTRKKMRTDIAIQLCQRAGVPTTRFLGLNDIPKFEQLLDVNIYVVSSKVGDKFLRIIDNDDRPNLYLYHIETDTEQHWHGIANIQGFFKAHYFCKNCKQPFNDKQKHSCETSCTVCLDQNCRVSQEMSCRSCRRVCRSIDCFRRHQSQKTYKNKTYPSQCQLYFQCKTCKKLIKYDERKPEEHICGEWKCPSCLRYHVGEHLCYQRSRELSDPEESKKKFIFFDLETRQDERMMCEQGYTPSKTRCRKCVGKSVPCNSCKLCQKCNETTCGLFQHKVNFAVLQTSCDLCQSEDLSPDSTCFYCGKRCYKCGKKDKSGEFERCPCPDTCGHREIIFKGEDTMSQFCTFITQEYCSNYILLAHNAKSFDLYPVLETLIERHGMKPDKIIYNGSKIMYMHLGNRLNLTFLDSLNFLPMPLAKIPEVFELEEISKGWFPHKFNTKLNQTYVGKYPPSEDYGCETMSSNKRKEFLEWYKKNENETFNFQAEMLKYCRSDVDILRRGCLKFRELMLGVTGGIDPFDYVTIASVCMGIFKTLFLKEEHEREIKNLENDVSVWYPMKLNDEGKEFVQCENIWIPVDDLRLKENVTVGETRFKRSPIAIVPSNGYVSKDNYSKASIQWLEWIMEEKRRQKDKIKIEHALNGGEFKIPGTNYRCDGYDRSNNTIYEFYGKHMNLRCTHIFCNYFYYSGVNTLPYTLKNKVHFIYVRIFFYRKK